MQAYRTNLEHLDDELARLDVWLRHEVGRMRSRADARAGYAGFYISDQEVDDLLGTPAAPAGISQHADQAVREITKKIQERSSQSSGLRLPLVAQRFGLGPLETDILILALAPELALRYQKIFGYLQDNVACKLPSIDLVQRLLCAVPPERVAICRALANDSLLVGGGLVSVRAPSGATSFLESTISVTSQARRFLTGCDSLDSELTAFCHWAAARVLPQDLPFPESFQQQVCRLAAAHSAPSTRCSLYGADRDSHRLVAQAISAQRQVPLLICDLAALLETRDALNSLGALACELQLHGAGLLCEDWVPIDHSLGSSRAALRRIWSLDVPLFVSSKWKWSPADSVPRPFVGLRVPAPNVESRQTAWRRCLADVEIGDLDRLARLPLSLPQIEAAAASAKLKAEVQGQPLGEPDIVRAAHEMSRAHLISYATRIQPRRRWVDLILPRDTLLQLHELCRQIQSRDLIQDEWGFGQRFSTGKAVIALFAGATGTGKTLAAEAVANELGLDLYKIDLASVVSKYVGETEKNLARVFEDAEETKALLFFDEADALFGKRSDIKDAHDRYANIEINYLLQRVEQYDGTILLASNLSKNIDPAFLRRLTFSIELPFPDEEHRKHIWQSIFPAQAPLAPNLDLEWLARNFRLAGGNIKNIAVAAAGQAAGNGGVIDMHHVILALKREYQKLGRVCDKSEFEQFYDLVRS